MAGLKRSRWFNIEVILQFLIWMIFEWLYYSVIPTFSPINGDLFKYVLQEFTPQLQIQVHQDLSAALDAAQKRMARLEAATNCEQLCDGKAFTIFAGKSNDWVMNSLISEDMQSGR